MKKYFVIFGILISLVSCKKETCDDCLTTYYFNESQCADPWVFEMETFDDESFQVAVFNYLLEQGIQVGHIERDLSGADLITCAACNCPSGILLKVSAGQQCSTQMIALGFYIE